VQKSAHLKEVLRGQIFSTRNVVELTLPFEADVL